MDAVTLAAAKSYGKRAYNARGSKRAVSAKVLDVIGDGSWYYNATHIQQDSVTTFTAPDGTVHRAAVFTAFNQKAYLYHWTLEPATPVASVCLSDLAGAPLATFTELDLHDGYCLAWDSLGYLHVAGNMHGAPIRYARTSNPLDVTAWTAPSLGADVDSATLISYPRWLNLPGGDLVFSWREGASGAGDVYWKRLTIGTGVWSNKVKVLDGLSSSPTQSAYYGRQYIQNDGTPAGVIHTFFIWAPDYDDLCYARSRDGGATWEDASGNALALPIKPAATAGTHATIYSTTNAAGSQGLINACPAWADANGHPHTANLKTVTVNGVANRQIMHLWWDGAAWQNQVLTNHRESAAPPGGGNPAAPTGQITAPMIFGGADGRIFIGYSHRLDNERGSYRCLDVSEPYKPFPLINIDGVYSDCSYDQRALAERDELVFMMLPSIIDPTTGAGGAYGTFLSGGYLSVATGQTWIGRWKSTWNAATAYVINDLVLSAGAVYKRITDGTSATAPASDATNWSAVTFAVGDCVYAVGPIVPGSLTTTATTNRTYKRLTTGTASAADITTDATNWTVASVEDWFMGQPVIITTVDLKQMGTVRAGAAALPHIKTIGRINLAADSTISTGSWTVVTGSQSFMTPPELRGKDTTYQGTWNSATAYAVGDAVTYGNYGLQYVRLIAGTTATTPDVDTTNWRILVASGAAIMCRLIARGMSGKAGRETLLHVLEREQGSNNTRTFGTIAFVDSTGTQTIKTPWMPCRYGAWLGRDGEIRIEGRQLGTGGGTITSCVLEIGVIAGPGTGVE